MKITQDKLDRKFNEALKELLSNGFSYVPIWATGYDDENALIVLSRDRKHYALLETVSQLKSGCYQQTLKLVELDERTSRMVKNREMIDYFNLKHSKEATLAEYYQVAKIRVYYDKLSTSKYNYFKSVYFLTESEANEALEKQRRRKESKKLYPTTSIAVNTTIPGFKKNAKLIKQDGHYYLVSQTGKEMLIVVKGHRGEAMHKVYRDKTSKSRSLNIKDWKKVV